MITCRLVPMAIAVTLAVIASLPAPVRAQTCGDGIVNLGEQCDDGNTVAGDCCSPKCAIEIGGIICRASSEPCDAAERCTGDSPVCPLDTGVLGDGDGDGLCDALDVCPLVADVEQLDRDADGLGDACDPCTNVFPGLVVAPRLRLRKLDRPLGEQRLKFRGFLTVPAEPAIDPAAKGLRFLIEDAQGRTVLDVSAPPGALDPATRSGWSMTGSTKWSFRDRSDAVVGVDRALVRAIPSRSPGAIDLRMVIQSGGNTTAVRPVLPMKLTVVVDPPMASGGQCAELVMTDENCADRNRGSKLICH